MFFKISPIVIFLFYIFMPSVSLAALEISEIMYDLKGDDAGREWLEVLNNGSAEIDFTELKFFEANTNHGLILNRGKTTIAPGEYAILADNPEKFLADWPSFSGNLFDSSFSLSNSGEEIAIKKTSAIEDQFNYNSQMGAAGDGDSLQKVAGVWRAALPTPSSAAPAVVSLPLDSSGNTSTDNSASSNVLPPPERSSSSNNTPVEQSVYKPFEPKIFAKIAGAQTAIVGAETVFRGESFGAEKKPLVNARYLWTFGDGAAVEGQNVSHSWSFPSDYLVVLEVASGEWSASNRIKIKVVPLNISIEKVVGGASGLVEILNKSSYDADLSFWNIKSGAQFFTFPKNTIILPGAKLVLETKVMKFEPDPANLSLLYPNGSAATGFIPKEETGEATLRNDAIPPLPAVQTVKTTKDISKVNRPSASDVFTKTETVKETENSLIIPQDFDSKIVKENLASAGVSAFNYQWLIYLGILAIVGGVAVIFPFSKKEETPSTKMTKGTGYEIIE